MAEPTDSAGPFEGMEINMSEKIVQFPKGSIIFKRAQAADTMYIVIDGIVQISAGENVIDLLGAGQIFGEMALIDGLPRSATATAHTDCKLIQIDERSFSYMVANTPYFALEVMRTLSGRLRANHAGQPEKPANV